MFQIWYFYGIILLIDLMQRNIIFHYVHLIKGSGSAQNREITDHVYELNVRITWSIEYLEENNDCHEEVKYVAFGKENFRCFFF